MKLLPTERNMEKYRRRYLIKNWALLSIKYQNIYWDSKPTGPQSVWFLTQSTDFSNTTSIATRSPSLQAGSGSACELQPSEKAPPLQREDKERQSNEQQRGRGGPERERERRVILNLSNLSDTYIHRAKNRPCSHSEQMRDRCVWTRWSVCHVADEGDRSHTGDKTKRTMTELCGPDKVN